MNSKQDKGKQGESICMDTNWISVIVPIYHGKQYLPAVISQLEACQAALEGSGYAIELLLVNDAPDEVIEEQVSPVLSIVTYNTEKNRGIHGARVYGLNKCRGEYVLFLDQDDRIHPRYFVSQLQGIGECDAVVCRLINDKKTCYNYDFDFHKAVTREYMLTVGTAIISPGQVLLRKSAIPEVWKTEIMTHSGADDYLLWLCMLKRDKAFALNDEILFEHIVNHQNTSGDSVAMRASEREMVDILKRNHVYGTEDLRRLEEEMLENTMNIHLRMLDRYHKMFYLMDKWMELGQRGITLADYLAEKGMYRIAVYGMNLLARRIIAELAPSGVKVAYVIDRNSDFLEEEIETCPPDQAPGDVDLVIVALVEGEGKIRESLHERHQFLVWGFSELLAEMEKIEP